MAYSRYTDELNLSWPKITATSDEKIRQHTYVRLRGQAEHYLSGLQDLNTRLNFAYNGGTPEAAACFLWLDEIPVGRDNNSSLLLSSAVHFYVGYCVSIYEYFETRLNICSLFDLAVAHDFTSIVRLLLDWGVDSSDCKELQRSPLNMASMLLDPGVDPIHFHGKTALHFSCESANDGWLVDRLLDLGLGVNDVDPVHRNTPLHLAAKHGRCYVASLLIGRGADLAARNAEGCTPLHLAVQAQKYFTIRFFLTLGPDLKCTDARGRTPLQLCMDHGVMEGVIIIKNLVKEEAITGIPMDKTNADYIESQSIWRDVRYDSLLDIERLKQIKCYPGITCFNLLSMSVKELAKRIKGYGRARQILQQLYLQENDLNYSKELNLKLKMVFAAKAHAHRVEHFVHRALGDSCLPKEVLAKIGEYLRPGEIRFK